MDAVNNAGVKASDQKEFVKTYLSFLENTAECIWTYSLNEQRFTYVSPAVYNLRGVTVEEAMQESLEDCLTPESREKIRTASLERFMRYMNGDRGGDVITDVSEYDQYCKDGSIITVEISTTLVYDDKTKNVDIFGVSRDVTKRKKYEAALLDRLRRKEKESCASGEGNAFDRVRVICFGKFKVYGARCSESVKWRTAKAEEMFAFFVHNKSKSRILSKWEICENLWPETELKKSTTYLHTTLYQMKKDLAAAGISIEIAFHNSGYQYALPEFYSDIAAFQKNLEQSLLLLGPIDEANAEDLEKVLELFREGYFAENGYFWSISQGEIYYEQFRSAALALARHYNLNKNYSSAKQVLYRLLAANSLDETAHELLLNTFLLSNDRAAFFAHYQKLKEALQTELGLQPNDAITLLYHNFCEPFESEDTGRVQTAQK